MEETLKNPRVQEAIMSRFNATEEEKQNPEAFVEKYVKNHLKEITLSYEEDVKIEEAKQVINAEKEDLVL